MTRKEKENRALKHAFYSIEPTDYGTIKKININRLELLKVFKKEGFYRLDLDIETNAYTFVHIKNKIVRQISITTIRDYWFNYLESLEDYSHSFIHKTDREGNIIKVLVTSEDLTNKFLSSINSYLSEEMLKRLTPNDEIIFQKDLKESKNIYYNNGFVTITKKEIIFNKNYSELKNHIWDTQILNRAYNNKLTSSDALKSFFFKFLWNVSSKEQQRYNALQTMIGYLLHDYKDYKLKAPILTDAFLGESGEANGRTGKGVFSMGIKYMANDFNNDAAKGYVSISGKNFDINNKHRYSDANINTKTIHLEDIKQYTDIEDFFNDITEGIDVDKKGEKPYKIHSKLLFSSNKTVKIVGGSAKDRTVVFEFADHYSSNYSPQDEFGHWFFKEWSVKEWQRYDYLMCQCIQQFFIAEKMLTANTINLGYRTLLEHTSQEFVTFLDYYDFKDEDHNRGLHKGYYLTNGEKSKEHNKKALYNSFLVNYPDYTKRKRFNQSRFTKWVKLYTENSKFLLPLTKEDQRRSNNKDYITFNSALYTSDL